MGNSITQPIPNTVTKAELKRLLNCTSRSYRAKFFTDEVIQELGMTVEQFNRLRLFDVTMTRKIFQYFNIVS